MRFFWSLGLQIYYCLLPPGLLAVLVPLALCLMVVPVIRAEWLFGNLSMTLEVYGEVVCRRKESTLIDTRELNKDGTFIYLFIYLNWSKRG